MRAATVREGISAQLKVIPESPQYDKQPRVILTGSRQIGKILCLAAHPSFRIQGHALVFESIGGERIADSRFPPAEVSDYAHIMAEYPNTAVPHDKQLESLSSAHELGRFLQRACHDLRTPLRAIRTHTELLVKNSGTQHPGAMETHLSFIVDGSHKIELLADGLSNYAAALRIEDGLFRPVPANLVLRTALTRLSKELDENRAEVIYDELPRVHGDPDRLSHVFENLLTNAVRHRGSASPRILIVAEKESTYWRFAVRDNGPGIESEYLERIFKPFERLKSEGSAGPGLGLTISREIVERHGGRIWAESEIGAGSTFLFTLPASG